MFIFCNILLIALVGLIAYWWANQGVFSAMLHLLCVIVAGAIAFAFWEPLVGTLLGVRGVDDYAWGVALVGLFGVSLLVLRIVLDRLVPANVRLPQWANLTFGGILGAAAGVLTIGVFVIGAGHIQSDRTALLGFVGWSRSTSQGGQVVERQRMWIPFHTITNEFYGWLSVTSLSTARPMRQYHPSLDRQATLVRDGFNKGRSKLSLDPTGATVDRLYFSDQGGDKYFVRVVFSTAALDAGQQLTLSASHVVLSGYAAGRGKAPVLHPTAWRQHSGYHRFDDITHYATSQSGQETAEIVFQFDATPGFVPAFIMIRGTRFLLPTQVQPAPQTLVALAAAGPGGAEAPVLPTSGTLDDAIRISNDIRPVNISTNTLPGSIKEQDRYLTSGKATLPQGSFVNRQLRILGILEPEGTKVVRVNVSRGGPADIFRFQGTGDGKLALVDVAGNEYTPIGFFHQHSGGVTIMLDPTRRVRSIDQVPTLPSTGSQTLELLFYVTEGVTLTGFRYGDEDVGTCNVRVGDDG